MEHSVGPRTKSKRTVATKKVDKSVPPERQVSLWKVGAHVSSAGGVENAVVNAAKIGCVCSHLVRLPRA